MHMADPESMARDALRCLGSVRARVYSAMALGHGALRGFCPGAIRGYTERDSGWTRGSRESSVLGAQEDCWSWRSSSRFKTAMAMTNGLVRRAALGLGRVWWGLRLGPRAGVRWAVGRARGGAPTPMMHEFTWPKHHKLI